MKNNNLYNNEAIASAALGHFMSIHKEMEIAQIMLVLPFLLDDQTVAKLNNLSHKRSIEEFIVQYPHCISNFNSRYQDSLPLSVNAVTILRKSKVIILTRRKIVYNDAKTFFPVNAGKRIEKIIKASHVLSPMLKQEKTANAYLKLKIHL